MKKKSLGQQLCEVLDNAYIKEYTGCAYTPQNWDELGESDQRYYELAAKRLHKSWTRKANEYRRDNK